MMSATAFNSDILKTITKQTCILTLSLRLRPHEGANKKFLTEVTNPSPSCDFAGLPRTLEVPSWS